VTKCCVAPRRRDRPLRYIYSDIEIYIYNFIYIYIYIYRHTCEQDPVSAVEFINLSILYMGYFGYFGYGGTVLTPVV
jgi:hypothetical protein